MMEPAKVYELMRIPIDNGRLIEVLPQNPVPARKLSILYPHRHISPKVRWLEGLLLQVLH